MKRPTILSSRAHPHARHLLAVPAAARPAVAVRARPGATVEEAKCPGCGRFRPGFCLTEHPVLGWRCDGCISDARRRDLVDDAPEHSGRLSPAAEQGS